MWWCGSKCQRFGGGDVVMWSIAGGWAGVLCVCVCLYFREGSLIRKAHVTSRWNKRTAQTGVALVELNGKIGSIVLVDLSGGGRFTKIRTLYVCRCQCLIYAHWCPDPAFGCVWYTAPVPDGWIDCVCIVSNKVLWYKLKLSIMCWPNYID